jgi:circadian clock protein KaiC
VGELSEVNSMLLRLIDLLQGEGITVMMTALTRKSETSTDEDISSLMDSWLLVRDIEMNGERNRALYIMKSRGMGHSKEVREFVITSKGLEMVDVYRGPEGILIGSARIAKEKEVKANPMSKKHGRPAKKIKRVSK